ncbi:MAG: HAMP domain-containing protein [Clostridiales bacterium]|nr:HAMP domain-containing protein [Clostridiales bacterium]
MSSYGKDEFFDTLELVTRQDDLSIFIINSENNLTYSIDQWDIRDKILPFSSIVQYRTQMINSSNRAIYNKVQEHTYTKSGKPTVNETLLFGTYIGTPTDIKAMIFVYASLDPIGSTVDILRSQLYRITFIVLVLAFVISFFISWQISRPITKITKSARQLGQGDYNIAFEGGGYGEVDELSKTLNYAAEEISKVDSMHRDLIASVSHDLRTPLTMIKAYAEMIRDISGDDANRRSEHIGVIIDEADRLGVLVSDILDMSRIESGSAYINPAPYDISIRLAELMHRFDALIERGGYQFEISIEPNITINADSVRIEQVMLNLINNAINYTGDDGRIIVKLYRTDKGVRFETSDTGDGIAAENIPLIWDKFYKVNTSHKRAVVGTGLGLYIVKNTLELHGFQYGVDSTQGKGSTFWFEATV